MAAGASDKPVKLIPFAALACFDSDRDEQDEERERQEVTTLRRIAFEQAQMAHERSKGADAREARTDAEVILELMAAYNDLDDWTIHLEEGDE